MKKTPSTPPAATNFPHPLRTLLVDDSVVFLEGLCVYLKSQALFDVVGTALRGREALPMAKLFRPDLVLMDLRMPVMNGLQATAILRRCAPNIRIIIMTMEDDLAEAEAKARAHGAHGFIWKARITNDLIIEVRRVFHLDPMKDGRTSP